MILTSISIANSFGVAADNYWPKTPNPKEYVRMDEFKTCTKIVLTLWETLTEDQKREVSK